MSAELREAANNGELSAWFQEHETDFTGGAKLQLPHLQIARFIMLYLGDSTIHEMTVTGELPANLKSLIYPLVGGRAVPVRGLREKLIAFGLSANMAEEEIDTLLDYARLRLITEPVTTVDFVLLMLLRSAHERYPYYEEETLSKITARLSASAESYNRTLLSEYQKRLDNARQRTSYYDRHERTTEEIIFEQNYTSFCDRVLWTMCGCIVLFRKRERDKPEQLIHGLRFWRGIRRRFEDMAGKVTFEVTGANFQAGYSSTKGNSDFHWPAGGLRYCGAGEYGFTLPLCVGDDAA
jgi:hypothetical protein